MSLRRIRLGVARRFRRYRGRLLRCIGSLPAAFDAEAYLLLNSDVAASPWAAAEHFLLYGRFERRDYVLPGDPWLKRPAAKSRPRALLVVHEASRTGAPLIAADLGRALSAEFDVVFLILRDGIESERFLNVGAAVAYEPRLLHHSESRMAATLVARIVEEAQIDVAVVNSMMSSGVIDGLGRRGIPTVALVHEFPHGFAGERLHGVLAGAHVIAFPAAEVSRAWERRALPLEGYPSSLDVRVVPQGLGHLAERPLPSCPSSADGGPEPRSEIAAALAARFGARRLILGAGSRDTRKGFDLFAQIADRVLTRAPDRVLFVWAGDEGDPHDVPGRSQIEFVMDLMQASDHLVLLGPLSRQAFVHLLGDVNVFALTSRFDPLPNVALEALGVGVPVVSFAGASGIPAIQRDLGVPDLSVPYGDVAAFAERLTEVLEDHDRAVHIASDAAREDLMSPARYARDIIASLHSARSASRSERRSVDLIVDSGLLDVAYWRSPDARVPGWESHRETAADLARQYVRAARAGLARRPFPGFNPSIFEDHAGRSDLDPFAQFIAEGCPPGPWLRATLSIGSDGPGSLCQHSEAQGVSPHHAAPVRPPLEPWSELLVHMHAHFESEAVDLLGRLRSSGFRGRMIVTTTTKSVMRVVGSEVAELGLNAEVVEVENRGRNLRPFVEAARERWFADAPLIAHLHTKRSTHIGRNDALRWRRFLLDQLVGGEGAGGGALGTIAAAMFVDPTVGLSYPSDPNLLGWGRSWAHGQRFLAEQGLPMRQRAFDFPVGGMFIVRQRVAEAIADTWRTPFPSEPLADDGTPVHALERIIGIVPDTLGLRTIHPVIPGLTR